MDQAAASDDRLTLGRLLILVAGVLVGLRLFLEPMNENPNYDGEYFRILYTGPLVGLSLTGPVILLANFRRVRPFGAGRLLWFTQGIGVWLLLPPAVANVVDGGGKGDLAQACLYYCLPFVGLWFLLAAAVGGHLTRSQWRRSAPWTERFGLYLGFAWIPLSIWVLWDVYHNAFD